MTCEKLSLAQELDINYSSSYVAISFTELCLAGGAAWKAIANWAHGNRITYYYEMASPELTLLFQITTAMS